jgi:hypothetical protein
MTPFNPPRQLSKSGSCDYGNCIVARGNRGRRLTWSRWSLAQGELSLAGGAHGRSWAFPPGGAGREWEWTPKCARAGGGNVVRGCDRFLRGGRELGRRGYWWGGLRGGKGRGEACGEEA